MPKKLIYIMGTIAVAIFFLAPAIHSQAPDMTHVIEDAFPSKERPASVFPHDEHNEMADLQDKCYVCHHYDGPDQDHTDMSIGMDCSDCHSVEPDDPDEETPLKQAYHNLCMDCHEDEGAGPVACGECHVR